MPLRARQPIAIPTSAAPPVAWDRLVPDGATGTVFGSPEWIHLFAGRTGASEELFLVSDGEAEVPRSVIPIWHFAAPTAYRTCDPAIIAGCPANDPRWFPCTVIEGARGRRPSALLTVDLANWSELAAGALQRYPGALCVTHVDTATAAGLLGHFPRAHAVVAALRSEIAIPPLEEGEDRWERYLASLPKRRRYKIRDELRALEAGLRTVEWGPIAEEDLPRIADLMSRTETKKGSFPSSAMVERWIRQVAAGPRASGTRPRLVEPLMFTCRLPDRTIIGGMVGIRYRDTINARTIGFDYDAVLGQHYEYPGLAIYGSIRFALASGLGFVGLGTTAEEAKLARGARAQLEWLVLLRPPAHWGADETRALNAARCQRWLRLGESLLGPDLNAELGLVLSGRDLCEVRSE